MAAVREGSYRGGARDERCPDYDKNVCVQIVMRSSQRDFLRSFAGAQNKSMSRYVKERLFSEDRPVVPHEDIEDIRSSLRVIVRQLQGEANNVNQIAHWANSNKEFPESAWSVIDDVKNQIAQLQKMYTKLGQLA
ncbi:MAG: MobC family plasmid mobilization relaxosome protein [Actinomycetaceae bacterium]|nr:MobC family plasmid mobilization relaxosome protein [Actinomycetaceae bacterium]